VTRLAAAADGAAGGCSQGCRKALPIVSRELYRAVVEPTSVFVAVCARSFHLGSSYQVDQVDALTVIESDESNRWSEVLRYKSYMEKIACESLTVNLSFLINFKSIFSHALPYVDACCLIEIINHLNN